ncbi:30S ribosomal protein S1 [Monoraphidium neglectum]|uniref:30S ribosomal protein S1 n=1 Tax=Monoraphidium neglectum TaxID=145388 RepID=A0A0D2N2S3_9CHLO|nr:30S ribosomal protein S1 [Monoraphidium neglectum]KIZ06677.1 30S ribosomal protein S1 [Monoraphidium neglectum]|eukprot:XP_013905696.1 30S ribosomal protein S1 [Monoraphidium neglectum]
MAFALRTGALPAVGQQARRQCVRPLQQRSSSGARRLSVAAIDQPSTYQPSEQQPEALSVADPELEQSLAVHELDAAQEDLLKWMLFLDSDQQEKDLDEMEDLEEVGDEEYAELYDEVETLLEESEASFKVGDKVYGTVYEVDDDGAYVEIGAKSAGFVPLIECSLGKLKTPLEVLRPGMKREFVVAEDEDEYGEIILSLAAIEAQTFWQRIRQLQEEDVPVLVTVVGANRGGLMVQYAHLEGFIPVSHLAQNINADNMETFVGYDIPAKFLEVDEESERLVFSHRRASSSADMQGYKVGDVVVGVVQSVRPYGAFVDIGGAIGLLHISQITHERLTTVDQVLAEGDKLKVMILSQDSDRGRVTLSTKKLEPEPGDMLRDPQKVFENADRMAQMFKERVAAADNASLAQLEGDYSGGGAYPPPAEGVYSAPMGGQEQVATFEP